MKRYLHTNTPLASLLFAVLLLFATAPAMAQHQHARMHMPADTSGQMMGMMQGPMMQGGMMGMMQHPMQRAGMMVYVLPTMHETLGLSEEQVSKLTQEKQAFMQERQAIREQFVQKQQQLNELFASEQPDPAHQVESTLKAVASLRAEAQALAYETGTTMSAMLSGEQRDQLAGMTPMQMHQHMMATMPMMEMMQAMHGGMMSGMGCPMMQGPMMQGGMMGMMQDAGKQ